MNIRKMFQSIEPNTADHTFARLQEDINRLAEKTERLERQLTKLESDLASAAVEKAYLEFDLEATQRERDGYRIALEMEQDRNNRDSDNH